jgi:MarR family transcriptional regulator for hemolysin
MDSLMKYINRIHRCAGQYRSVRLPKNELRPHQHIYIFHVCRNPGISQEELTKLICVNKSSVTRQLSMLEKHGYITRETDKDDRRMMRVYPTQEAEELYPKVVCIMKEWNELLLDELSFAEKEQFIKILERLTNRAIQAVEGDNGEIPDFEEYQIQSESNKGVRK